MKIPQKTNGSEPFDSEKLLEDLLFFDRDFDSLQRKHLFGHCYRRLQNPEQFAICFWIPVESNSSQHDLPEPILQLSHKFCHPAQEVVPLAFSSCCWIPPLERSESLCATCSPLPQTLFRPGANLSLVESATQHKKATAGRDYGRKKQTGTCSFNFA